MRASDRGFALLTALWALVLVGALAGAYLAASRDVVLVSDNRNAEFQATLAARAGLEQVHNAMERLQTLGTETSARLDPTERARLARVWNHLDSSFAGIARGCLDDACYEAEVRDLGTLLNVNLASEAQLRSLFLAAGADYRRADVAAQSIADWIDADDLHRARGAERAYYVSIGSAHPPRNAPIADVRELARVRAVDGEILESALAYLTVEGRGRVNLNAAPQPVLAALPGFGPEIVQAVMEARRRGTIFANLFEVSLLLGPYARARLQEHFAELASLAAFEPEEIQAMSSGRRSEHPIRVTLRAVYVRSGARVAQVKRWRLEP
ncbi:MAG: general secretion pathway protein GspK [Gemmatimonadota bacterium]